MIPVLALGAGLACLGCAGTPSADEGEQDESTDTGQGESTTGGQTDAEEIGSFPGFDAGTAAPFGITVDDARVYVGLFRGSETYGSLVAIPKSGGEPEILVPGPGSVSEVIVDGTDLIFDDDENDSVQRVAKTGGQVTLVTDFIDMNEGRVVGDDLYFVRGIIGQGSVAGRVPKNGGEFTTLWSASDRPVGVELDADFMYIARLGEGSSIESNGDVARIALAGGPPESIAANLPGPRDLLLEGSTLYATVQGNDDTNGGVVAIDLPSGQLTSIAEDTGHPWDLEADATHLYWASRPDENPGRIWRIPKTGGTPELFIDNLNEPRKIAIDATHLYVADFGSGKVWRKTK